MDTVDKKYFSDVLGMIQKQLETLVNDQQKTCDELKDVSKEVVALTTSFKNHLDHAKQKENQVLANKINKPQWVVAGGTAIMMIIAVATLMYTIHV